MLPSRVLMVVLDAFTPAIAERRMAAGHMPALGAIHARAARFRLEHGTALRTGMFGEHIGTGIGPELSGRRSAVVFDPRTYRAWQEGTWFPPFCAGFAAPVVAFDPTYVDFAQAPAIQGLVGWGAHDPGAARAARPDGLHDEVAARFGPYPAAPWIYAQNWWSPARTRQARDALVAGLERRGDIAVWLLGERLPVWRLAMVTVSELHSLSEAMWHGIDSAHPHHGHDTAPAAAAAFDAVYGALDRFLGRLAGAFPDAALVIMCMHAMGPNEADLASMALLPELLCRAEFGCGLLRAPAHWVEATGGLPALDGDEEWEVVMGRAVPYGIPEDLPAPLRAAIAGNAAPGNSAWPADGSPRLRDTVAWMPAERYHWLWPHMQAFALPAFLDGRVRINLQGREARGRVDRADYDAACSRVEALLLACRDIRTGEPVARAIERTAPADPGALGATGEDLYVLWRGVPVGFEHPELGRIGPLPFRRTGSHTGGLGLALLAGAGLPPGEHGVRSAFDIVPTIIDLLGEAPPRPLSGRSLIAPPG